MAHDKTPKTKRATGRRADSQARARTAGRPRKSRAEQRALLGQIDRRREEIGPVGFSVSALVRQMREGGLYMPAPTPQKPRRKRRARRVAIPKPSRALRPEEQARFERTQSIRESFGKLNVSVSRILREMRDQ